MFITHTAVCLFTGVYYFFLRKRLTTDRLSRQQKKTHKQKFEIPVQYHPTRETITATKS